jgi:hypothetical protein
MQLTPALELDDNDRKQALALMSRLAKALTKFASKTDGNHPQHLTTANY